MAWGAAIGALGNVIGGAMGMSSANKANKISQRQFNRQMQLQENLMHHGVRWRVQDAKRAGIHPLAALGANVSQFSPIGSAGQHVPSTDWVGKTGQNIGRAVTAAGRKEQQAATIEYNQQMMKANLKNANLRNDLLASQIQRYKQTGPTIGGDHVIQGQGDSSHQAAVIRKPVGTASATKGIPTRTGPVNSVKFQRQAGGDRHRDPAFNPDVGYTRTKTGWAPVYGQKSKEQREDDIIGSVAWNVANRLAPTLGSAFGVGMSPPFKAPKGMRWFYHPMKQEYQLLKGAPGKGKSHTTTVKIPKHVRKGLQRKR